MQESVHTGNIPVSNVDKTTTEEWTRGRHWHQTDTTEINGHKRFGQMKKNPKQQTAWQSLDGIHHTVPATSQEQQDKEVQERK